MITTQVPAPALSSVVRSQTQLRRFAGFSLFAAVYTYALIVFGGIVRITNSGMGCGDDWPKCNGSWVPEFSLPTLIEYTHRLLGVSIGLVLIAVFAYAFAHRRRSGFGGKGGLLRIAGLVLALVVLQGLLGAVTVWLEIPPSVVVVHFLTALIILAVLLYGYVRARQLAVARSIAPGAASRANARTATAAAGLGFAAVAFGALVANHLGAPQACQGFPLCNGSVLPPGGALVHLHWLHRLIAFALLFYVLYAAVGTWQRGGSARLRYAALGAGLAVVTQVGVAAALVLLHLPRELQALHLAVGAAGWASLILWAAQARAENGD